MTSRVCDLGLILTVPLITYRAENGATVRMR